MLCNFVCFPIVYNFFIEFLLNCFLYFLCSFFYVKNTNKTFTRVSFLSFQFANHRQRSFFYIKKSEMLNFMVSYSSSIWNCVPASSDTNVFNMNGIFVRVCVCVFCFSTSIHTMSFKGRSLRKWEFQNLLAFIYYTWMIYWASVVSKAWMKTVQQVFPHFFSLYNRLNGT